MANHLIYPTRIYQSVITLSMLCLSTTGALVYNGNIFISLSSHDFNQL